MKNDEKVYMQLRNFQQVVKWVEVYYEHLLQLTNWLQVKATNVFFTSIFRASLKPYNRLATTSMTKDTLIKHKEGAIISLLEFLFFLLEILVKKLPLWTNMKKTFQSFWTSCFESIHCDLAMYFFIRHRLAFLTSHFN
jgi:hypothetical protein